VMTIPQEPHEPRAQAHPVVQQALRQETLQFFNSVISHAKGPGR
jgi:hypothetical protein